MSFLLDTNVVSELERRRPNVGVLRWFDRVRPGDLHLSVLTIGQIRRGIERVRPRNPTRAAGLETWLAGLRVSFRERILPIDAAIAEQCGRLNDPNPAPIVDSLLAATALVHDWTVVTRNAVDFDRTGVRVLNPFE